MMRNIGLAGVWLLGVTLLGHAAPVSADELNGIRQEVREVSSPSKYNPEPVAAAPKAPAGVEPPRRPRGAGCSNSNWDCDEDESMGQQFANWLGGAILGAAAITVTSPYWGPHVLMEDDFGSLTGFRADPYVAESYEDWGFLIIDQPQSLDASRWAGLLSLDYGTEFDDLQTIGGEAFLEHASRWGVDARWRYFREDTEPRYDELTLGATNLSYRFAQSPRLVFRSGVGLNWLTDRQGSDFGFNWMYNAEWCPAEPLVLRAGVDLGSLGDAFAMRTSVRLGWQFGRWQTYIGGETFRFDGHTTALATTGLAWRF